MSMNMYYAPIRPRPNTRTAWLADIAAMLGSVIILTVLFFFTLTGEDFLPSGVQGDDHRQFIADLCPHLPENERQSCRAWLATGGRDGQ